MRTNVGNEFSLLVEIVRTLRCTLLESLQTLIGCLYYFKSNTFTWNCVCSVWFPERFRERMFSFVYFIPVSFLLSGKFVLSCTFELCNLMFFRFSTK